MVRLIVAQRTVVFRGDSTTRRAINEVYTRYEADVDLPETPHAGDVIEAAGRTFRVRYRTLTDRGEVLVHVDETLERIEAQP